MSFLKNEIYFVAPFWDKHILETILNIVLEKEETANIGFLYFREPCCHDHLTFEDIWKTTIAEYSDNAKTILKEKVFTKARGIDKKNNCFHAKFVGCVNNETEEAEILMTSANFTKQHFYWFDKDAGKCNRESLSHHEMSKAEFERKFINPVTP